MKTRPRLFARRFVSAFAVAMLIGLMSGAHASAASATTTALTSSANPSNYGQPVTFTATVTPNTATGTVDFYDGSTKLDSAAVTLSGGVATFAVSSLSIATHSITATYNGDVNDTASTSNVVSQVVSADPTTITLSDSDGGTSVYGQQVCFTATVSNGGTVPPTGSVTFMDGSTTLDTEWLSSGIATVCRSWLSTGAHSITASYGGDAINATSTTASALTHTVNQAGSRTDWMSSDNNPSVTGQTVTFNADIDAIAPGGGTPTGTATFFDGTTSLGTVTLNSYGHAYLSTSALTFGNNPITVSYSGDTNHSASTSSVYTQVVKWSTAVAINVSPPTTTYGHTVTVTATVTSAGGVTPPGSVEFATNWDDSDNASSYITLNNGVAVWTTTLHAGSYTLVAEYEGDSNNGESSGSASVTVNQSATATSLAHSFASDGTVGFSAAVTSVAPGVGTPTGNVNFVDSGNTIGTVALNGSGTATFNPGWITLSGHNLVASYAGDGNYLPSTSSAVGTCGGTTFVADFSGDGKADLANAGAQGVCVAPSNGSTFGEPSPWTTTPFYGSLTTLAGDINGDGKSDLVAVNGGGTWVMTSNGSGFNGPAPWSNFPFYGNLATYVGDVTGDGKADLIAINSDSVWVMPSMGSGFGPPAEWSGVPFFGTVATLIADVNGDGKADLIALNADSVWVMVSNGVTFASPQEWSAVPFYGTVTTLSADVAGTGNAAMVAVNGGSVWVMTVKAGGGGFNQPAEWSAQPFYGSIKTVAAKLTASSQADLVAINSGSAWVETANGTGFGSPQEWSLGFP